MHTDVFPTVADHDMAVKESSPEAGLVITDHEGQVRHCNAVFPVLVGLPEAVVIGTPLHEIFKHLCVENKHMQSFAALSTAADHTTFFQIRKNDSVSHFCLSRCSFLSRSDKLAWFFSFHEIHAPRKHGPLTANNFTQNTESLSLHKQKLTETTASLIETNVELRREIRDHLQALEALQESETRFRNLTETTSDFIWEINREGLYTYASPKSLKLLGYTPDELINTRFLLFRNPENVSHFIKEVELAPSQTAGFSGLEYSFTHKDGHTVVIESSGEPILSKRNECIGFRGIDRDVTERFYFEKKLKLARRIAEQANHAKSEFLANMSHELRTPLHAILSFSKFGEKKIDTATKDELLNYFQQIGTSANRLIPLINNLLDLSKLEAGKMTYSLEKADLSREFKMVVDELKYLASQKNVTINLAPATFTPYAVFDPERIGQVIRNILSNALKFCHIGTTINIHFQQVTAPNGKQYLQATIGNIGVGIPAEELDSIFDKFAQSSKTKTGAGGTGLGLSICKEILGAFRGDIWAENNSSGETQFHFTLPTALQSEKIGQILVKKGLVSAEDLENALKDQ